MENKIPCWAICNDCEGRGKKKQKLRKGLRVRYEKALAEFEKTNREGAAPILPEVHHLSTCITCGGTGLIQSPNHTATDTINYPHVAIIGGGIGGVALAVACMHRGIPFTLYERDSGFDTRSQGYGLTLQQASKAIQGLGIFSLAEGITSNRHVVHTTDGKVIGEWGARKWLSLDETTAPKRVNVHIARQSLRLALLQQLGSNNSVQWGHQLLDFKQSKDGSINLNFKVAGQIISAKADLVVGADGIRSTVRSLLIGEDSAPLRYLDCIVILGICPLSALQGVNTDLLDSATVFQTANGHERIYIMPYDAHSVMWQLSFPMAEEEAKALSAKGAAALKAEACRRTQWHTPIPEIVMATQPAQVSGYPVYDRALLQAELLENAGPVTLLGDAAHPMSPFKGQGANQALLDALALAREISNGCKPPSSWKTAGLRQTVLTQFEAEMLERSARKVKDSADAAQFLHSQIVLQEVNGPRRPRPSDKI